MATSISQEDIKRIATLFEIVDRASREEVDEHLKNEAANAFPVLLRLLGKYGLSISDVPELQRQHEQNEAAKRASSTTAKDDGPNVLELLLHVLKTYDDIEEYEFIGIALWVLYKHVFEHFQISPRLALLSPVPGCGKTKTLKLMNALVANPELHSSITQASLCRVIDDATPTLLLDEGDNAGLKVNATLRAVLNDGWTAGGRRTITVNNKPKFIFSVHSRRHRCNRPASSSTDTAFGHYQNPQIATHRCEDD